MAAMKLDMQVHALANVKQHPTEILRAYIQCFTVEASKLKWMTDSAWWLSNLGSELDPLSGMTCSAARWPPLKI